MRRSGGPGRVASLIKAEVVALAGREPRDNARFVITNLRQTLRWIYETVYCQRGEIENRIKELHHGLEIDRTICTKFWANQLRVLLTAAAYVLLQECAIWAETAASAECPSPRVGPDPLFTSPANTTRT